MKREAPSDREIAEMIAPAFDRLPAPDPRRLAAIERHLLAEKKSSGRSEIAWWWLAGALLAGAASALWWAVDYDSGKGPEEPIPGITAPTVVPPPAEQRARPDRPAGEPTQKQGPVIYQRER